MTNPGMDPGWLESLPLPRLMKFYDLADRTREYMEQKFGK